MRYIMGCLKMQFDQGVESLEVRSDVFEEYNEWVDQLNLKRAWGSPAVWPSAGVAPNSTTVSVLVSVRHRTRDWVVVVPCR